MLKLSGEVLVGKQDYGIDPDKVISIADDINQVYKKGKEICIVVGGGNIFRGVSGAAQGIDRVTADGMGMLGTVINALALQNAIEKNGIPTRVLSAIPMQTICESFIKRRAIRHLEKNRIIILAAGTGNPYFSTDTAATLRAAEMNCDVIFKGTSVDGVYESDPKLNPNSKKYCRACQACADLLIQAGATIPDYSASTSNDSDSDDTSSEGSGLGGSDDNAWF